MQITVYVESEPQVRNLFMCLNICVNAYTYSDVRQSWAVPALRWKEDCGRTWVLMASAVQAPYAV